MSEAPQGSPADARTPWLVYVALTAVVWGLFVAQRGLWHDEVQNMFRAFVAPGRGEGFFPAITMPTRRLLAMPYFLALRSGYPLQALQLLSGLAWLLTGVAADRLARRLWPQAPLAAVLAGALTLSATPDFFTNALTGISYQLSILAYLGALLAGLSWLQGGSRLALLAAPACVAIGSWTTDVALSAWALTPLLWLCLPARGHRRFVALGLVWYLAALPYLFVLARQWATGGGYLRQALVALDTRAWLERLAGLLLYNFTPWRWAFDRPLWFPRLAEVVPLGARLGLAALVAALACALVLRGRARRAGAEPMRRAPGVLAALALMAAANAIFVSVQLSELFCRTHLLSRVFACLALAGVAEAAWARARASQRGLLALLVGLWLALGLAGGLERQDYLAGYWRAHRQELGSILSIVPALAPDAHLLLKVPAHERYLATEAGYLARAWLTLLYQDASVECRVFLWSQRRPTTCSAQVDGFECRGERSPDCQRLDGRESEWLAYGRLVVLEYRPERNEYVLLPSLPASEYRPEDRIAARPAAALGRALLGPR